MGDDGPRSGDADGSGDGTDGDGGTTPDPEFSADEKRRALRAVAREIREGAVGGGEGETGSEAEQVAATLYRVSDLYDPDEETSAAEIYRNVRYILGIKEQGGIDR